ncbi:hypothetical protein ABFX02_05G133100 [Erythranthe guttata]
MADEVLYSSVGGGESNKRKYEDSPSPARRRTTGFSSAPDSSAPPSAYNNVPPPMNEIELAKQKAQEIAARLLNNSDPLKRARVENGGGGDGGFDSSNYGSQKPMGLGFSAAPQVPSSGYPGPSKKIEVPNGRVGVIIGKGGETIKYLQLQSGAKIQVTRDMDADPNSSTRGVDLMGTPEQIAKAEQLINDVLSEAEAGGSGIISRRVTGQPSGSEQFVMMVANNKVGLVIGKGGETIKNMQARTGARIQVIPLHLPPGDTSKERTVQIDGTSEQIEAAKQLVEEVTSENRPRNQSMSGGYSQQGYQARPPTNWAPQGPPQQSGYGYTQPGAYPTQPPQYNMNQPPYSGYPPQPPTSGGYPTTWDPSAAPQQNQQAPQAGAYDYYNQQQQQQTAPADGSSGYGYGQAQAYNQGYGQDGYGGYQSGYNQPPSNPASGYDNQQGYNSSAYGSSGVSNPTPDSQHSAAASYGAQGEAVPSQNYPPQATSQTGYGAPPPQKPPAYAQPQQSPSAAQGGGGGYAQPGYAHSQTGYAQPDSGAQRPPSSGYQQGYGAPPYGGPPPPSQPSYGQQQPPSYGGYGGGYSQPPAYSADGAAAGGNAHGSYDATPPPQSAQSGGPAKASPPS